MRAGMAGDAYFNYREIKRVTVQPGNETCIFYVREPLRLRKRRLIAVSDFRMIFQFLCSVLVCLFTGPQTWRRFTRLSSKLRWARHKRKSLAALAAQVDAIERDGRKVDAEAILRQRLDHLSGRVLMLASQLFTPKKAAKSMLCNQAILEKYAGKSGAIFWVNQLMASTFFIFRAFKENGHDIALVAVDTHGDANTRFGIATINRLLIAVEDKFLSKRLEFSRGNTGQVTRSIVKVIEDREFLLMANNIYAGSVFVEVPYGDGAFVDMPTSPISVALKKNVPLIATSTFETDPLQVFETDLVPLYEPAERAPSHAKDYDMIAKIALRMRDVVFANYKKAPAQSLLFQGNGRSKFNRS